MTPSASAVSTSLEGETAIVTLTRPERRNALDSEAARAVAEAIRSTSSARVTILTGSGGAFCAGGDLEELEKWSEMDPALIGSVLYDSFQSMIRAVRASDSVVIAAIDGAAVGAGMDLALACDLRIASSSARMGQVWVRLGVIPGTGGAYLTQALAGPGRAAELLLTGELIGAEEALQAGLVNEVVPPDELMAAAHRMGARILRHPREGVIANKRAMVAASDPSVEAALEHAAAVQPGRFTSDEFKAAVAAARKH
ncbi:MAG TPA: enoyl-CoA hydratase/isomerase family protein [Actinomycetota bacterium]|nr:enoyl-CoA hydratase/isomerase family protein [Actinomycetota bacterium]